VPEAEALEGPAESIPLPDASVDAAFAAQAFHWFDRARAVPELHRVIRPKGGLALLWNWWDVRDPLQRELGVLIGYAGHEPFVEEELPRSAVLPRARADGRREHTGVEPARGLRLSVDREHVPDYGDRRARTAAC